MRRFFIGLLCLILSVGISSALSLRSPIFQAHALTGGCNLSAQLPLDVSTGGAFTAAGSAAISTCALSERWLNGKLFDISINSVVYTIRAVNGYPDVRRLAALLGISPLYGSGGAPILRAYDQSGSGNDFTQSSVSLALMLWLVNGNVYIAGDGALYGFITSTPNANPRYLIIPTGVSVNSQASSIYTVVNQGSSLAAAYNTSYSSTLWTIGSNPGVSGNGFSLDSRWAGASSPTAQPCYLLFDWATFSSTYINLFPETSATVIGHIAGSSSVTLTQNEESATTGAALTSATYTGGSLGNLYVFSTPGAGYFGTMQAFMVDGGTTLNSTQQTAIRNSLYSLFGIQKSSTINFLMDGASLDVGEGSLIAGIQGWGVVQQMNATQPYKFRLGNTSQSGVTLANLTATWAQGQSKFFSGASGKKVLFAGGFGAAGNSITGGETGAQAYADLQAYLTAAKATTTFDMILVSTLGPGTEETNYNNLIIANAAALGITIVPAGGDTVLWSWPAGTGPYFNAGGAPYQGHPTALGYSVLEKYIPPLLHAGDINYLFKRDLDPATNDNSPMWLNEAA